MDNESGLLAYLIPRLTSRSEDTATEALAFILKKSEACRRELDKLLSEQDLDLASITRLETQVKFDDECRPDMVGYDNERRERLVVESKFWAALLEGQASCYFSHIDESEPGILLFIAPATRIETLWAEIKRQMETGEHPISSESGERGDRTYRARVVGSANHLMLVSWDLVLERLAAAASTDPQAASDIQQLRGFTDLQDLDAFQPIQREELSPSLARRVLWINKLVDNVVERGVEDGWMSVDTWHPARFRTGSGRNFRFVEDSGASRSDSFYLGTAFDTWATMGDTPLWLTTWAKTPATLQLRDTSHRLGVFEDPGALHAPIYLMVGVEYHRVLDDVTGQLRRIREIIVS